MTTTTAPAPVRSPSVWRAGLVTAAVAAALNTLVWFLGQATPAGWEVDQGGTVMPVYAFMPAVATVVGVAAGTVALWVLRRFPWGLMVWTVGAVLVGLGSTPSPLQAATDTWTGALLATMHVLTLVVALVLLRPAGRRRAGSAVSGQ